MSLINQMLRDLQERQGGGDPRLERPVGHCFFWF